MKRYQFTIYSFDPKTKEIRLTAEYKTKPISIKKLKELIKNELITMGKNSCYRISE